MTAKEKADELVEKFMTYAHCPFIDNGNGLVAKIDVEAHNAKQCALIAVDEMVNEFDVHPSIETKYIYLSLKFWQEVKKEIESL